MMRSEDTVTLPITAASQVTAKAARLARLGARRMTRAHLSLSARPSVVAEAQRGLEAIRGRLEPLLGCSVAVASRLLEAAVSLSGGLSRSSAFALLELAPVGAKGVLEIDLALTTAILERLSGGTGRLAPATRLTRIEEAAFGYLCLSALAALRREGGLQKRFSPRLLSLHAGRDEVLQHLDCTPPYLGVEITIAVGAATGLARLILPSAPLQVSLECAPVELPSELAPQILSAAISARVLAGKNQLDPRDLRRLRPKDVVLLAGLHFTNRALVGQARVQSRTFELLGCFESSGFTFSRAVVRAIPQESPMVTQIETNNLPVEVEVELTRVRLSLSELSVLQPGAVLPLHINTAEPVLLKVGDRAVARAELVDVEGEVGARVIALLP